MFATSATSATDLRRRPISFARTESGAVLLSVLKNGNASTLDIVSGVRKLLPRIAATLPPELRMQPVGDQSIFVRAAISGVIREALIAACLTAS